MFNKSVFQETVSITFNYLIFIMHNFTKDITLKEMIERTIIFYIFTRAINKESFNNIKFIDYYQRIQVHNILPRIIKRVHENEINIFESGVKKVESIILDEFAIVLK